MLPAWRVRGSTIVRTLIQKSGIVVRDGHVPENPARCASSSRTPLATSQTAKKMTKQKVKDVEKRPEAKCGIKAAVN
jgi:hypothetical protein